MIRASRWSRGPPPSRAMARATIRVAAPPVPYEHGGSSPQARARCIGFETDQAPAATARGRGKSGWLHQDSGGQAGGGSISPASQVSVPPG